MIRIFVATAIVAAAIPVDPLMAQARLDAALADSLRGWVVNMGVRFHARDAEAMIAMYADSAYYVHIGDGVVTPYAQLVRGLRASAGLTTHNPVSFVHEPRIIVLDSNTAIADYDYEMRPDPTVDRVTRAGIWTGVLRRGADGWHILHAHISGHAVTPG